MDADVLCSTLTANANVLEDEMQLAVAICCWMLRKHFILPDLSLRSRRVRIHNVSQTPLNCVFPTRLDVNRFFSVCVLFYLFDTVAIENFLNGISTAWSSFFGKKTVLPASENGKPRWEQEMNGKRCFQWIRLRWLVNIIYSAGKCVHRKGHSIRRFKRFTYVFQSSLFRISCCYAMPRSGPGPYTHTKPKGLREKNAKLVKNKHTSGFRCDSFSVLFIFIVNRIVDRFLSLFCGM